jgi:hypothetical protein
MKLPHQICLLLLSALPISACSTHPLQDEATNLNLADIVYKIRCEAKQEINRLYFIYQYDLKEPSLKQLQAQLKDNRTKRSKYPSSTDLEDQKTVLIDRLQYLLRRQSELKAYMKIEQSSVYKVQLEQVETALNLAVNDAAEVTAKIETANKISTKIENISKEITSEAYKNVNDFVRTGIVFNFRFKITENNDLTGKGAITWPVHMGTLTLGYDVGDKRQRVGDRVVKIADTFGELNKLPCEDQQTQRDLMYPISGYVGLNEVIDQYYSLLSEGKIKFDKGQSYQDTIQFTTTLNGSVNPQLNLIPTKNHLVKSEFTVGGKREDFHELVIYIALPQSEAESKPVEVSVARMPSVNMRIVPDILSVPYPTSPLSDRR